VKRSEVNKILKNAKKFFKKQKFELPPWAFYSPEEWKGAEGHEEIVESQLGWDLTDFGSGDFKEVGLLLFTIRNGSKDGKPYAEKIMIAEVRQVTPMHYHWNKMEDIINRGGGDLRIKLYNCRERVPPGSEEYSPLDEESDVTVKIDSIEERFSAGEVVTLKPGQSICLPPYLYHEFWGERKKVLIGEVSSVNNDDNDNKFLEKIGRFPEIEEDEEPIYLLCNEYERVQTK